MNRICRHHGCPWKWFRSEHWANYTRHSKPVRRKRRSPMRLVLRTWICLPIGYMLFRGCVTAARTIAGYGTDVSLCDWWCRITRLILSCHALMQKRSSRTSCLLFWPLWNILWISLARTTTLRRTCYNYYLSRIAYYRYEKWGSRKIGRLCLFGKGNIWYEHNHNDTPRWGVVFCFCNKLR